MAYRFTSDGFRADASVISADGAHPDYVRVPDAALLFTGDFRRAGPDLVLTGADGRHHVVPGYFAGAHRPALVAPNGASLSPDVVELLAGSPTPGEYAQAQPTAPPAPIGKVEKVVGSATAMRNGVAVVLHVGDPIYKSDVIQTGAGSSVGISFPDGTALNLIANTRMALTDFSYDPNGHSNTALLNLVEGTFAFVAGKVAHTGDMKIETPVATMGIRGTTGYVQEVANITATLGSVTYSFAVVGDYGTNRVGEYELIDANGDVIATVSQSGYVTYVTPQGPGQPPLVTTEPMTNSQLGFEQQIIQQVFQVLNSNVNPQAPGTPGSSTQPPGPVPPFPQLLHDNGGQQLNFNIQGPAGGGTVAINGGQYTVSGTDTWSATASGLWITALDWNQGAPPIPQQVVVIPDYKVSLSTSVSTSGLEVYSGATFNIVDGGSFTVTGTIGNSGIIQINSSGADPTLALNGSVLLLGGGKIEMIGPTPDNLIVAASPGATLTNVDNTISGSGTIGRGDGALTLVNGVAGTIEATPYEVVYSLQTVKSSGVLILDTGNAINNSGLLEAGAGGTLQVFDIVDNAGLLQADAGDANDAGGILDIKAGEIVWDGGAATPGITGILLQGASGTLPGELLVDISRLTLTGAGGAVFLQGGAIEGTAGTDVLENVDQTISGYGTIGVVGTGGALTLTNDANGIIDADNVTAGETLLLIDALTQLTNHGTLEADGGILTIKDTPVANYSDLSAVDGKIVLSDGTVVTNTGTVQVDPGGKLVLDTATISGGTVTVDGTLDARSGTDTINGSASITIAVTTGTLEATGTGQLTLDTGKAIINQGTLEADGATTQIQIDDPVTNTGKLLATRDGTIVLAGDTVTNGGGKVEVHSGSTLDLEDATISGGIVTISGTLNTNGATATSHIADVTDFTNSGTTEATDGKLVINLGATLSNAGTLAADVGTLQLDDSVDNSGLIEATGGGELYVKGSEIDWDGSTSPAAGSNGVLIGASSTLLVDSSGGTLTLGGTPAGGTVSLQGGTITADGAETLDNVNNKIVGYGTIGDGNGAHLTLDNETDGIINANASGDALIVDAGQNVANAGRMEATHGGELQLEDSAANSGGTIAAFGAGSIVQVLGITITDGTLKTGPQGTVDVESGAGGSISTLDDVAVTNNGTVEVAETTTAGATVVLDDDTRIVGGNMTIGSLGEVNIVAGVNNDGAIFDGLTVTNGNAIDVNATATSGSVIALTLDDGTTIVGGAMTVGSRGALDIEPGTTGTGATLDDVTVTNNGTITVDKATKATLTLEDDTSISGGALQINSKGTLSIVAGGNDGGATLDGVNVTNDNAIDVNATATSGSVIALTLDDGTTIGGGSMSIGTRGEVDVVAGSNNDGATFDGLTVTNGNLIEVGAALGSPVTLTLDDGTKVTGGSVQVGSAGDLVLNDATLTGGTGTLTLTNGNEIEVTGNSSIVNTDLTDSSTTDAVYVENGATLTLDGATIDGGKIVDKGTIDVTAADEIESATVKGGGTLKVDGTQTLTLDAVTINGVTVDDYSTNSSGDVIAGTIDVTGDSLIENAALNNGGVTVEANEKLTLDDVTVTGTTFTDTASGAVLAVDGGDTLTLSDTTIDGGTIDIGNYGVIDSTGVSFIDDATLVVTATSIIEATDGGTLTIDSSVITNTGELLASGGTLVLSDETINNYAFQGSHLVSGTVQADGCSFLDLDSATINGGIVTVSGTLKSIGVSSINYATLTDSGGTIEATGGTLTINTGLQSFDNQGTLEATNGATLALQGITENSHLIEAVGGTISITGLASNASGATIETDGVGSSITISDVLPFTNAGQIDVNGGSVQINDSVFNSGALMVSGGSMDISGAVLGGSATIDGGTLDLGGLSSVNVAFSSGAYGALVLADPSLFTGDISGFNGSAPGTTTSDEIELAGLHGLKFDFATYNSHTDTTTLLVVASNGLVDLKFAGDYVTSNFSFDQVGDNIDIFDPPASSSPNPSVAIGGPGNDHFLFHPDIGADTAGGFEPQHHAGAYDHFADAPTMQELASLVAADAHGDAFIHFGHDDGVTIPGVTASYLQAHLHSLAHLHG